MPTVVPYLGYRDASAAIDWLARAFGFERAQTLLDTATAPEASRKHVPQPDLPAQTSLEDAKNLICKFLDRDAFEEWTPSPKVRIKLIAPGFPDRGPGDSRLARELPRAADRGNPGQRPKIGDGVALSFNTLLPKPGPDEFAMPFKALADQKAADNTTRKRNRNALPLLIENELLADGDVLVLSSGA